MSRATTHGRRVAHSTGFEWLARAGIATYGVVYVIIGVLAIKLALGDGGKATNQQGALHTIAQQPLGKVLLVLVAIGLGGYAFWRLTRAALGHGKEDSDDAQGRIAALFSGLGYAALCATAVKILVGSGSGGGSGHPDKATAGVLGWPGGPVLVVIAGLIAIGVGLYQGYRAVVREFMEESKTAQMSEGVKHAFAALGIFGHLARMVVFGLVGWFLIKAAIDYDPKKAVGLDGALAKLAQSTFGPLALGIVAAGLIGFGLYALVDSRYHKV
jgi:hypothetical protein